jgi:hypothetical protein
MQDKLTSHLYWCEIDYKQGGSIMKNLKSLLFAASIMGSATAAQAIVYTGSHAIGPGSISISITTDGTLGVLAQANVIAWSFTMTNSGGTDTINEGNSSLSYLSGNAFQATATDIVFDYTAVGHMQWDSFGSGGNDVYCLDTPLAAETCLDAAPSEVMIVNGAFDGVRVGAGRLVLGTTGAVPEPASWAMMIAGFGLVGAASRRRRNTAVAV